MKRAQIVSEKRKIQMKQYYLTKIRPFRQRKVGLDIYSCPFCGMMNNLTRLRDPSLHLQKIYIREGCNWFSPGEYSRVARNPAIEVFIFQKWEEFMKDTCDKTFKFLKWALNYGLITRDRIILEFDLKIIQKTPALEKVKSSNQINSAEPFNFSSILNLFSAKQSSSATKFSSSENLQSPNQLKPIKSMGGVSNG